VKILLPIPEVGWFFILFLFLIILYPSCIAYDRPRLSPRHFLVFYLCSRVGLLPYNPARRPAFIKAPRLLGSLPSYRFSRVATTTSPHLLLSHTPIPFSYHRLDTSGAGGVRCPVHVVFLVRPFDYSAEGGRDLFSLVLTRSVYCACPCPPAGRANRALVLGILSGVTHLIS
jgi:hypothetical protein